MQKEFKWDYDWDYAMSGDELENLRDFCNSLGNTITSLMWDKGIISETKDNDDWDKFIDLTDDIWQKYSKEKNYDECEKILLDARDEIIKKYDLKW